MFFRENEPPSHLRRTSGGVILNCIAVFTHTQTFRAGLAQWQSSSFVNCGSSVQSRQPAPFFCFAIRRGYLRRAVPLLGHILQYAPSRRLARRIVPHPHGFAKRRLHASLVRRRGYWRRALSLLGLSRRSLGEGGPGMFNTLPHAACVHYAENRFLLGCILMRGEVYYL